MCIRDSPVSASLPNSRFLERIRPCKCKCKNFNLIQQILRSTTINTNKLNFSKEILRKHYDLKFFLYESFRKSSYRVVLSPFEKEFRIAEIIKIKRNTTRIFLFQNLIKIFCSMTSRIFSYILRNTFCNDFSSFIPSIRS